MASSAAVLLLLMGLFVCTSSPTVYWIDSNEFVVTSFLLGNAHPPGHPLYTLLGKAATLLPFGSIAFRVNLLSGFCAVLTLGLFIWAAFELLSLCFDSKPSWPAQLVVLSLVALLAVTRSVWFQAVRAEVYTLHSATALVVVALVLRWYRQQGSDQRLLYQVALITGLGLGNHHFLLFLVLPGLLLLVLWLSRGRELFRPAALSRLAAFLLLGLSVYLLLVFRAVADTPVNWGDPSSVGRFIDVLTAKMFQRSIGEVGDTSLLSNMGLVSLHLLQELGPAVIALGLLGLSLMSIARPAPALALWLLLLANMLSKGLMAFDPSNPDGHGYLIFSLVVIGLGAAYGAERLVQACGPRIRWLALSIVLLLVLGTAGWRHTATRDRADLSDFRATEELGALLFQRLPLDSVVLHSYYTVFFNQWYLSFVENRRPDLSIAHLSFALGTTGGRGRIRWLCEHQPDLCGLARSYHQNRAFPGKLIRKLAKRRPIFLENHAQLVLPVTRLHPTGILLAVDRALGEKGFWKELRRRMPPSGWALETRQLHYWFHVLQTIVHIRRGEVRLAALSFDRARTVPGSPKEPGAQLKMLKRDIRQLGLGIGRLQGRKTQLAKKRAMCQKQNRQAECWSVQNRQLAAAQAWLKRLIQRYNQRDWGAFLSAPAR